MVVHISNPSSEKAEAGASLGYINEFEASLNYIQILCLKKKFQETNNRKA